MPIQSSFQDSGWGIKYQNQISTDKNLNQRNRFPFLERELIMCYHICPDVGPHACLHQHKIRSVLNCSQNAKRKAYRKEKVGRAEIELFKKNLKEFIASIDPKESEEHVKNNVTKFLYDTYYNGKNQINTKGWIDLAIYEDKKPVVIIEAKRPSSPDMVSAKNLNTKAMHELMLYYLRERIDEGNIDIK